MKKFISLFVLLVMVVMTISASDPFTINMTTGTVSGSGSTTFGSVWTGSSKAFVLHAEKNNIKRSTDASPYLMLFTGGTAGGTNSHTYTLAAPAGYTISSYTITGRVAQSNQTVTAADASSKTFTTTEGTFTVDDVAANSTTFTLTGDNYAFYATIEVTYEVSTLFLNIPLNAVMTVGEQSSTVDPTTENDDSHWYILTQTRGGESAMYDAGSGTQLKRASTTYTASYFAGKGAYEYRNYLVRFIEKGTDLYNIQFADGRYVASDLTSSSTPADFFFYNINIDAPSHFGWNLTTDGTTYGNIVDNNGAGYTVSYWETGKVEATGGNNDWSIYPVTFTSHPQVYSFICSYEDGDYPLYNNDGTPNISDDASTTPQLLVVDESEDVLAGADVYNIQRAEGDGNYLAIGASGDNRQLLFSTTPGNYLFLNSASALPSGTSFSSTTYDEPYFQFYGWYIYDSGNFFPAYHGPKSGGYTVTAETKSRFVLYGTTEDYTRDHSSYYNYKWTVTPQPYTVYTIEVKDASSNTISNVPISYANASDAAITRTAQTNGGFFVISNDVTPAKWMFNSDDVRYKVSAFSLDNTTNTITLTLASTAVTSISEGRYVFINKNHTKYLTQSGDVIGASASRTAGDVWVVVPTSTSGKYYIRNEQDGKYIKWNTEVTATANATLVDDPADATPYLFSTSTDDVVTEGCFAIKYAGTEDYTVNLHMNMSVISGVGYLVRWGKDVGSDWLIYPVPDDIAVSTDYIIMNTRTNKYATRVDDASALVQNAKGEVSGTNSVWTLTTSGDGYKMANGGTNNLLANYNSFTADGTVWYIQNSPQDPQHKAISSNANPTAYSCLCDKQDGTVCTYWGDDNGAMWHFVTVDEYYLNAVAYMTCLYDEDHKNDLFYISESAYDSLTTTPATSALKVEYANAMYNVLDSLSFFNMPEDGEDYILLNLGIQINNSKNRYLSSDDTYLINGGPYNSTYFWHMTKGENAGEYYMNQTCYEGTSTRYINVSQGGDATKWVHTTTKPASPLTLQLYNTGKSTTYFGNVGILAGSNRMNANADTRIITWNRTNDDNCKWQFISVEEASVPLLDAAASALAAYNEAVAAGTLSEFLLTAEGAAAISTAKANLEADYNYQNYYILEQLLNAASSYYQLASGRYLVRNYNYNVNLLGRYETYLSSLTNPMGVVEDAITYWSVWDIDSLGNGEYTMRCEGNRHIFTPTKTMADAARVDSAYLFYDASAGTCKVGTPATGEGDLYRLRFYPAASFKAQNSSAAPVSGSYAVITAKGRESLGRYIHMHAHEANQDHIVMEAPYANSANYEGTSFFWQFIPISETDEVIQESESEMFLREVNGLEGYVGGVVTLHDVSSVPCLNDIVELRDEAAAALANGTALSYTSEYDHTNTATTNVDSVGVVAFRDILRKINAIKNDDNLKKYYQDLRPTENIDGVDVTHPFFLENLCGWRPSYGSRLTEDNGTSWYAANKANVTDGKGIFYVTRQEDGDDYRYILNNKKGNYLAHELTGGNSSIQRTTSSDDYLWFAIDPVIPGVWQMRDVITDAYNKANSTSYWPYLTITGTGAGCKLMYYNFSEISTLWKFSTFNELDDIVLKVDPEAAKDKDGAFYATFSFPLNIKVPEGKAVPYYCNAAYRSSASNTTNANLSAEFTAVDPIDDYYYLQANQGYLFKVTQTVREAGTDTVVIKNSAYLSGDFPAASKVDTKNIMVANLTATTITNDNWSSIYALTYNPKSTLLGYYYGTPVYGVGMGFYHIPVGGLLKPQTAYIPSGKFTDNDNVTQPTVHESSIPAEMVFEDQDGNIVDRVVVLPDGTWQSQADDGPVYDLTGRRVTKPTRGIYIQNGRKVMYTK